MFLFFKLFLFIYIYIYLFAAMPDNTKNPVLLIFSPIHLFQFIVCEMSWFGCLKLTKQSSEGYDFAQLLFQENLDNERTQHVHQWILNNGSFTKDDTCSWIWGVSFLQTHSKAHINWFVFNLSISLKHKSSFPGPSSN